VAHPLELDARDVEARRQARVEFGATQALASELAAASDDGGAT
jgi:hypothetical protein